MDIDTYIRVRLQRSCKERDDIMPSRDFTHRVMMKAITAEKRRTRMAGIGLAVVIFAPLLVRLAWSLIRQDYFSLSNWPLASFLVDSYHLFMSSGTMYALGIVGVIGIFFFVGLPQWRTRQTISQFRSKFS